MDKNTIILGLGILGLAAVNIAAIRYMGIFAFFVLAASFPFAEKILDKL